MILALLAMLYGLVSGWRNGLMKELLSSGGFVIGLILAWYFHDSVAGGGIVGFLVIMIGAPIVLGWLASLLNGVLDHLIVLGSLNRLAGALVGALKYAILFGVIYWAGQQLGLL